MPERVRLVVWDLDDTFWKGTVTEEGFVYDQTSHDIVVRLAERGIVSTICSKNNHEQIKQILVDRGIWDYFVLPSINWDPKGPRLKMLIEQIGLRPETVLFIDDNTLNLQEAKFQIPGLQISGVEIIPEILSDPRFVGKDDRSLSRLKQYKVLQQRQEDAVSSGASNSEFLRTCDITVELDFDVARNLDRAIELINRTNQLNFTKRRLPEDIEAARAELGEWLKRPGIQASLIRVRDKYGDHGYAGFYMMNRVGKDVGLLHFCFSCRILNMDVEKWVYRKLGRPWLRVKGEVLTDLFDQSYEIDWIRQITGSEESAALAGTFPRVLARGGCDVSAIIHYFSLISERLVGEFNFPRSPFGIRLDHSQMLRYSIEEMSPEREEILLRLGYRMEDFQTEVFGPSEVPAVRIFSCWADADVPLYRHRTTGTLVPFWMQGMNKQNVLQAAEQNRERLATTDEAKAAFDYLVENFEYAGLIGRADLAANIDAAFRSVPRDEPIYVIFGLDSAPMFEGDEQPAWSHAEKMRLNQWLREIVSGYDNTRSIDIGTCIASRDEIRSTNHFDRMVYFRLYEAIRHDVERSGVVMTEAGPVAVMPNAQAPNAQALNAQRLERQCA